MAWLWGWGYQFGQPMADVGVKTSLKTLCLHFCLKKWITEILCLSLSVFQTGCALILRWYFMRESFNRLQYWFIQKWNSTTVFCSEMLLWLCLELILLAYQNRYYAHVRLDNMSFLFIELATMLLISFLLKSCLLN